LISSHPQALFKQTLQDFLFDFPSALRHFPSPCHSGSGSV
jgi:hypothetical protein